MGTTLRQLINMNTLRLVILAGIVAVAAAADSCYVWAAVTSDGTTTGVEFADKVSTACGVASDCLAVSYSVDSVSTSAGLCYPQNSAVDDICSAYEEAGASDYGDFSCTSCDTDDCNDAEASGASVHSAFAALAVVSLAIMM